MNTLQNLPDYRILEKLAEKKIDYFSFTLFKNGKPQVSHCNHRQWLDIYNKHYHKQYGLQLPPGVQYIFGSTLRLLMWDFLGVDKQAEHYIKERNNVVGVSTNITLLYRESDYLTAITLGTKNDNDYLIDFFNKEQSLLAWIEKNLIYSRV